MLIFINFSRWIIFFNTKKKSSISFLNIILSYNLYMLSLLTEYETDKKCSISAIARLKTVDTWKSNITFFWILWPHVHFIYNTDRFEFLYTIQSYFCQQVTSMNETIFFLQTTYIYIYKMKFEKSPIAFWKYSIDFRV